MYVVVLLLDCFRDTQGLVGGSAFITYYVTSERNLAKPVKRLSDVAPQRERLELHLDNVLLEAVTRAFLVTLHDMGHYPFLFQCQQGALNRFIYMPGLRL